jgi:hypothetical protein
VSSFSVFSNLAFRRAENNDVCSAFQSERKRQKKIFRWCQQNINRYSFSDKPQVLFRINYFKTICENHADFLDWNVPLIRNYVFLRYIPLTRRKTLSAALHRRIVYSRPARRRKTSSTNFALHRSDSCPTIKQTRSVRAKSKKLMIVTGSKKYRQRQDSNLRRRSLIDFESISLTARTRCHIHSISKSWIRNRNQTFTNMAYPPF